ncbi:MAG: response regulator [Candidatus Polarisedimenticolia bacterium]
MTGRAGRTIRVLIVDDNTDVAASLADLLSLQEDIVTAGVIHRADGLPEQVALLKPDVVLLDLSMPGEDPLAALQDLAARHREAGVLICSAYDDPARMELAMKAGARGYVSKLDEVETIVQAVRTVATGGVHLPSRRT